MKGHWFCDHCDDIVFMSYEAARLGETYPCPSCGQITARFIPQRLSRKMIASEWFAEMRKAIERDDTGQMIF